MNEYFLSIGSIAALNIVIAQFINSIFNIKSGWIKQVISWIVPILVSILGLIFGLGIFAGLGPITSVSAWIYAIVTGLGTGLVSNGIYDTPTVQTIINTIKTIKINK